MSALKPSPIPKHHQLAEILRGMIRAGSRKPGDQLPTKEKFCARHEVSREPGRGTFVRNENIA